MRTEIALLRGINLGPHHRVPMADLRALAESVGLHDPTSYIRSGNLVFDVDDGDTRFAERLETALSERFGFEIPVVTRSRAELADVAQTHPLASPHLEERFLMVAFLDRRPDVDIHEVMDEEDFAPDRFDLRGRDVFLAYPNGQGRSKLSHDVLQRRLDVRATIRNWKTISKLVELSDPAVRS